MTLRTQTNMNTNPTLSTLEQDIELVAKFDGFIERRSTFIHPDRRGLYGGRFRYFQYNRSFDWLMPVRTKIIKLFETDKSMPRFEINSHHVTFSFYDFSGNLTTLIAGCYNTSPEKVKFNSEIEALFYIVVKLIKWYNANGKIIPRRSF